MIQSYLNFLDVHAVVILTAFTDYLRLILYYNHCLHRWKRHSWEYWQRHESIRHGTIWLFVSVAHFELVVLLSHSFTVIAKSWAKFKALNVLCWSEKPRVCFPPAFTLTEVFCTDFTDFADILFRVSMLPFSQTYLLRLVQKPHKDIRGF